MAFKFYNPNPKQKFTDDCVIRAISKFLDKDLDMTYFTGGNMYEDHENLNYLAHHGILGMKWGKQNGPPYPLSDAKHDRVVKRAENKRIRQEKRADRRRKNILKDPKKIVKYQDEFSKDEIETALDKMSTVDKVKSRIPESKLKQKIKKIKLSEKKKRLASTPDKLEKNLHKLSDEEAREALQYLKNTEELFNVKINRVNRPKRAIDVINGYIQSISNVFGNTNTLRDNVAKSIGGYTIDERHKMWVDKNTSDAYLKELLIKKKNNKNSNNNDDDDD